MYFHNLLLLLPCSAFQLETSFFAFLFRTHPLSKLSRIQRTSLRNLGSLIKLFYLSIQYNNDSCISTSEEGLLDSQSHQDRIYRGCCLGAYNPGKNWFRSTPGTRQLIDSLHTQFDMDGTLVDSIGAVEQAWGNVALGEEALRIYRTFQYVNASCSLYIQKLIEIRKRSLIILMVGELPTT